ncbi:organomercurial lyase [Halorientalis regularis]|uniref:Alkylmercury lyase n=1 Tax=Halorientalis regularis TaxID=660518 RepID=A0A1G7INC1_9EURY|nr:organomercurial lyase [Halorientalis regularis]SDF14115.1 Alkylmercury lyase [Halorientalis regularis]
MTAETDSIRIEPAFEPAAIEIPGQVGERIADLYGVETVRTAEDWLAALTTVLDSTDGEPLGVADLCTTDESPHVLERDGERQAYQCVYDPMIVPFLTDEPAAVTTVCPTTGETVTLEIRDGAVDVTPETAVFSIGVDASGATEPPSTPAESYGFVCPYGNAFADWAAYEDWAADTDAVTAAIPLEYGVSLAGELGRQMAESGE